MVILVTVASSASVGIGTVPAEVDVGFSKLAYTVRLLRAWVGRKLSVMLIVLFILRARSAAICEHKNEDIKRQLVTKVLTHCHFGHHFIVIWSTFTTSFLFARNLV